MAYRPRDVHRMWPDPPEPINPQSVHELRALVKLHGALRIVHAVHEIEPQSVSTLTQAATAFDTLLRAIREALEDSDLDGAIRMIDVALDKTPDC